MVASFVAASLGLGLMMAGLARADYETDCADPDVTITDTTMPGALTVAAGTVVELASGTFTGP